MKLNENGRKLARSFLLIALAVSVVGNVTHTVLADSTISLWLRVPGAVVWPVFTWGAIEIVVRIVWQKRKTHTLARTAVLFPAVPAAITSYEHLYNLLGMMGERPLIQWIGPAAIDGLMIGCTLTLLFTRDAIKRIDSVTTPDAIADEQTEDVPDFDAAALATIRGNGSGEPRGIVNEPNVTIVDDPKPISPSVPRAPRAPRTTWDASKVIDMMLEGSPRTEIQNATAVPNASFYRLQSVVRKLTADRNAAIDSAEEKVRPEHVDYIRKALTR